MEKPEDYDLISLNLIINSIWVTSEQIPSKIIKTPGISHWIFENLLSPSIKNPQELLTQTFGLFLVPAITSYGIFFYFLKESEMIAHFLLSILA